MNLFRTLSPLEEQEFRQWARKNYKPFEPISGVWHPIVQHECTLINMEAKIVSIGQEAGFLN